MPKLLTYEDIKRAAEDSGEERFISAEGLIALSRSLRQLGQALEVKDA